MTIAPKALPTPTPTSSAFESPLVGGDVVDGVEVGSALESVVLSLLSLLEGGMPVGDVVGADVVDDMGLDVGLWLGNQDIVPPRLRGRLAMFSSIGLSWKRIESFEHLQFAVGGLDPTTLFLSGHPAHEVVSGSQRVRPTQG